MQDRLRYVGTIHVNSEPVLTLTEVIPHDASGNQQLENGEQSSFDMVIKNAGDVAASSATATLTSRTLLYVTINQNTATIPALNPGQTTDLNEVFDISISDAVPHGTELLFTLTMVSGSHTWTSDFAFNAYAPDLKLSNIMTIDDGTVNKGNGNGRLDPGEAAEIAFTYTNNGGIPANNVTATLSSAKQQYIFIDNPTITTATVDAGETVEVTYSVRVAASMPRGDDAQFTMHVTTGSYTKECSYSHRVGLEAANFENGMDGLEWQNDPEHPWAISSTDPYSGQYCLQSGTIGLNATSTLSLPFYVENEIDEIRFSRKTDCHTNDHLKFYIDDTEIQQWSGSTNWREIIFPVTQGEHVFTWAYEKDGSGTAGSDHVWIDDIILPVRHLTFACNAGANQHICQVAAQMEAYVIGCESLLWTTNGDGSFDQNDILNPTYTPGEQDLANKTVTLTLTATNEEGETLSDNVVINFHEAASIEMEEAGETCEGEAFQLSAAVNETGNVIWVTDGDGSFDHPNNLEANYIPGEQDKANGQVTLTLKAISEYGCGDTEHSMLLTIHPLQHTDIEVPSCGAYTWNGIEYNEEGVYEQTLQSIHGCDSTVVLHLTMVYAYNVEVEQNACDSYIWAGETIIESGIYEHTFTSLHGCDSTVVMHLTINESSLENGFSVDACEPYEWDGIVYAESGLYERIYTNIYGCDSIVTMDLAIIPAPVIETINGDTEIDVRLTPTSVYSTSPNGGTFWSLDPEEAGTVVVDESIATITWSETYKGDVILHVWALGYCGQDESSMTINVKNSTDVNEYSISAKLYPNPTNGIVNVEAEGLQRLTVMNVLGQVLYDQEVKADNAQINMTQFDAGTYLIRIHTLSGTTTRRINVM